MKKTMTVLALFAAGLLAAADSAITSPEQLTNSKRITAKENGVLEIKGMTTAYSKKIFDFDPAKKYSVSGEFRQTAGTKPAVIFFGLQPLDKNNRQILTPHTQIVAGSDTVLTKDAAKGATFIEVKDASKWIKGNSRLALNTDLKLKDLPNFNIVFTVITSVEKLENSWKVNFSNPLRSALKKGTRVREHRAGGAMYPAAPAVRLSKEWKTFSGTATGVLPGAGYAYKKFPIGTAKVQMLLFVNYGQKDAVTEIRNLTFKAE